MHIRHGNDPVHRASAGISVRGSLSVRLEEGQTNGAVDDFGPADSVFEGASREVPPLCSEGQIGAVNLSFGT